MKLDALKKIHWVNAFYLVLTPVVTFITVPMALHYEGWNWSVVILSFLFAAATSLGITAGYHRYFAHRSYQAKNPMPLLYLLIGASSFQGSALKWATDHRRHHRMVDSPDDPYNINQGFFYAHMGWLILEDNPKYVGQYPPDLMNDKLVAFQHKHYLALALLTAVAFPTIVGFLLGAPLSGFAFGAALRLVLTNHSTFFINSLCHMVGTRPYSDKVSARDSWLMAFLAHGEGYHNYHHVFQTDYRNGIRWYQWDPTKWFVGTLNFLGFASNLKRTPAPLILKAQLEMQQKAMLEHGASEAWVIALRNKVEEAQRKVKILKEDYALKKADLQIAYTEKKECMKLETSKKICQLKAEIKLAKMEFRLALARWGTYRRRPQLIPAYG